MTASMTSTILTLPDAPAIPGLRFRRFQGEDDYPHMLATINAAKTADQDERHDTLEEMVRNYSHLTNCDPSQDLLIAEVDNQMAAYSRIFWELDDQGSRLFNMIAFMHPNWRRRGIGRAMLHANERRAREIAASLPPLAGEQRFLVAFSSSFQPGYRALLEQEGYQVTRVFQFMVRPDLENIPDLPLPAGLEVRPAQPEHYHPIWEAFQESFQDHWGYVQATEEDYQHWMENHDFQPDLWQVAWEGDEVAGMILNFINHGENEEYQRKRGYTEGIAVRRPWRRRGLARALLARSLQMHRDLGMQHAALGVDSQSLSGANILYESMGFQTVRTHYQYRKPLA